MNTLTHLVSRLFHKKEEQTPSYTILANITNEYNHDRKAEIISNVKDTINLIVRQENIFLIDNDTHSFNDVFDLILSHTREYLKDYDNVKYLYEDRHAVPVIIIDFMKTYMIHMEPNDNDIRYCLSQLF